MAILDTLKGWIFETPKAPAVAAEALETKSYNPNATYYGQAGPDGRIGSFTQVYNDGEAPTLSQEQAQLSVVFLTILSNIQASARAIPWGAYTLNAKDETATVVPQHPLADLLYTPNPNQSWTDFVTAYLGQYLTTGNVFIYLLRNESGSNKGKVQSMYLMPADTEVIKANSWIASVQGYKVRGADGNPVTLAPEDVLHIKTYNADNYVYGLSPVQAGALTITSLDAGMRQRIKLLANGGPKTVLSDASPEGGATLTPEQEDDITTIINRPNRLAFLPSKVAVQQIGASAVDLDIMGSLAFDAGMLADLLGYPSMLLSGSDSKTFNNYDAAMKALYTGCVIPHLRELQEGLNRKLGPIYKDKVYIDLDTSGIEFLKENQSELITAVAGASFLTPNEQRKMIGLLAIMGGDELPQAAPAFLDGAKAAGNGQ